MPKQSLQSKTQKQSLHYEDTNLDNILSCQKFAKTHLLKQYLHPIANREEFGLSKEDLAYQKTNRYQIRDVQNEILFSKKSKIFLQTVTVYCTLHSMAHLAVHTCEIFKKFLKMLSRTQHFPSFSSVRSHL